MERRPYAAHVIDNGQKSIIKRQAGDNMTQRISRKWLVALGVASALAASPAFAAKDVVVAVGSNFTTLDPYDANDTLSQAVAKSFYQGAVWPG
ncbi:Glutathione-binding protein gsiB precursor [Kluyvera cryocrescens]|uniref:Glutathione-binding protein gsiB n=1 Tax=Kluyvera cryocrescens TaxID=580 RepID=A0A485D495_KLUCR|nr:Glutathione-binding protein gsiB precursor [Kluyvera cryocrescens]